MKHPFHSLISDQNGEFLFAAFSDKIQKINLATGNIEATYTIEQNQPTSVKDKAVDGEAPPSKKTKTETSNNNQDGIRSFRTLEISRDGKYLIGTESKSVHVINASDLSIVSQRTFPKRPSCVATTKGDANLLVGDKFGDVYSVDLLSTEPLILSSSETAKENDKSTTGGLQPILGHVSMLVDLKMAENNGKEFIITADRDEHVRVTNFPEAYDIERWLFGHKEFVSALTLIPWNSEILVSGGGDDFLAVWNWAEGKLLQQFEIRSLISEYLNEENHTALRKGSELEISVSSIVALPGHHQVAVLCEATRAVLILAMDEATGVLTHQYTYVHPTSRILALAPVGANRLAVSFDSADNLIDIFSVETDGTLTASVPDVVAAVTEHGSAEKAPGDQEYPLYSIKHLRKRGEF